MECGCDDAFHRFFMHAMKPGERLGDFSITELSDSRRIVVTLPPYGNNGRL